MRGGRRTDRQLKTEDISGSSKEWKTYGRTDKECGYLWRQCEVGEWTECTDRWTDKREYIFGSSAGWKTDGQMDRERGYLW